MPKRFWLPICALALLVVSPGAAGAQASPWRAYSDPFFHALFRNVDDAPIGIPRAIARDGRGFVWVGYSEGLARWDGAEFKTYGAEPNGRGPALPEASIAALHADVAGELWVGFQSQGLARYDAKRDAFVRSSNRTALDHAAVGDIVDGRSGALWVASNVGLAQVDRATGQVRFEAGAWLKGGVEHLAAASSGVLWASHGSDLERRDLAGLWTAVAQAGKADSARIVGLTVDGQSRVWVVRSDGVITIRDAAGQLVRRLKAPGDASLALSRPSAPHNGRVWIASNEGLLAVDTTTFAIRNIRHDAARSISLPQDDVTALFVDRDGLMWVGSDSAMAFADLDRRQAYGLSSVFASRSGDGHATPSVVRAGPDGALWLGQNNAPLQRLDPLTGVLAPAPAAGGVPAPRTVLSLAFAPDGRLLAGAGNGIFEIARDGVVRRRISTEPVRRLLIAGDDLYAGGATGLTRTSLSKPGPSASISGLSRGQGHQVNALARSASGALWVGTVHGLYGVDPALNRTRIIREGGQARSALDGYVTTLHVDRAGRLWAGAIGGLFLVTHPENDRPVVRRFGLAEGLPNTNIDAILESRDGALWVSTDKGIVRIDPQTFAMHVFLEAEGVAFANNWADGGDVLPGGELVFAGVGGLTFIDPAFPARAPAPSVMLTDLRVGERSESPTANRIEIAPRDGPLSLGFASPDLAAADRIGFVYRLKELDRTWTRVAPHRRGAELGRLPPGRYTLEVRATDRMGTPGGEPRRLQIVARPSLTQTWWFRSGLGLVALGAVAAALFLRHRAAKLRQAHLESLVERRTAELRSSQAELEQLAYFDPLTGLANRRMFQELLAGMMKPDSRRTFALLVVDLDRFKAVNDSLGHDAGDALLSQVAARLASLVRANDGVYRLGGDEFALLVQDVQHPEEVAALCTRLLNALAEPIFFQGGAIQTGLSLGVALYPDDARSPTELFKLADTALYEAKAGGRGTWRRAGALKLQETAR